MSKGQTRLHYSVARIRRTSAIKPNQVIGLVATPGDTLVNLRWTRPSYASTYTVERATSQNGTYSTIGTSSTNAYTDTGRTNGTAYWYKVAAVNTIGTGAYSLPATATPTASVPGQVVGLVVTPGNTQNVLAWTATATATSYHVKRSTVMGGPYTTVGSPATNAFTDMGLANGTKYYYVVSALNASGEGLNSAEASGTPVSTVSFGLNIPSATTSHLTQAGIGITAAFTNGYKYCRCTIGMDAHGNTSRPYQNSTDITTIVNDAIDAGLLGISFNLGANPSLSGTAVLALNSGVSWLVQTRPPSTVWPWIINAWQDAIDTAIAACVAKGVTAANFLSFEGFNEYGKGGVSGPKDANGNYTVAPYNGYDYGFYEAAFFAMGANIASGVNFHGCPFIPMTTESAEVDSNNNGTQDCDTEIASMTGADYTTLMGLGTGVGFNCYSKQPASPYVKATAQAAYLAKVARQIARLLTVTSLTPELREFGQTASGWNVTDANGAVDVLTHRDAILEALKTQTGTLKCALYTAFTGTSDANFYSFANDGSALRGILVAP